MKPNNHTEFKEKETFFERSQRFLKTYLLYYQNTPILEEHSFYPRTCNLCNKTINNWLTIQYDNLHSRRHVTIVICLPCANSYGVKYALENDVLRLIKRNMPFDVSMCEEDNYADEYSMCIICRLQKKGYSVRIKINKTEAIFTHICNGCIGIQEREVKYCKFFDAPGCPLDAQQCKLDCKSYIDKRTMK